MRQRSIQNYLNLLDVLNDSFFMQRVKKNCAGDIFKINNNFYSMDNFVTYKFFRYKSFSDKKTFYKKMSLKDPRTLRKCYENLQHQMPDLQSSKTLTFFRAL